MDKMKVKALLFTYRLCKKIRSRIVKTLHQDRPLSPVHYVALTPTKIIKRNEYFNAMDFALSKNDIKNIAVTGAYGAGKSTVISSYLEENKKGQFINVSLAGFEMQAKGEPAKAQAIELSILQQILYKKNRDALPDSRIDRILNRNWAHVLRVFISSLMIAVPLGALLSLIFPEKVLSIYGLPENVVSAFGWVIIFKPLLLVFFSIISLFSISYYASRIGIFDKKIKLSKVGLLSGEIEMGSSEASSLLNNCLDEMVYFFSKIKTYRTVVFEDLDRLNNPEIFVKLREINKIINNNLTDEDPLRFIYAVRDDIFSVADARTKFFDFIIPVVPVMDIRNAFSILNTKLNGLIPDAQDCLRGTAAYIKDMRCLQNIVNEYLVFSKVVDNKNRRVSLYALVFYKNAFAHDYSLIDRRVSILYRVIQDYRLLKLHEVYYGDLNNEVSALSDKLTILHQERASTPQDIREEMIRSLVPLHLKDIINIQYSHNNYHFYNYDTQDLISSEQSFMDFMEAKFSIRINAGNSSSSCQLPASQRQSLLDDYIKRKQRIEENKSTVIEETYSALAEAKEKVRRRNAVSLSSLITQMSREVFSEKVGVYLDEMKTHDFISEEQEKTIRSEMRYGGIDALYLLLSRGFLDQDYMRSRSIFREGGLSSDDNEFVKNVALGLSCEKANAEYSLDDVSSVLIEISAQHLLHYDGVMHHQILTHMLRNHDQRLDEMIATLFSKEGEYILKVLTLLETRFNSPEVYVSLLIRALDANGYLDKLIVHLKQEKNKKSNTSIAAAVVSWISPDCARNVTGYREYVELLGTEIVHFIDPSRLQSFLTYIKSLRVSYENLSPPVTDQDKECIRFIGTHHLYRLTSENVGIVLSTQLSSSGYTVKQCRESPWTLAASHKLAAQEYFIRKPDTFVRDVFLQSQEDASAVYDVLRISSLSDELKLSIVRDMRFCLDSLSGLPEEPGLIEGNETLTFHDMFYRHNRIYPDWDELMVYIRGGCNQHVMTDFISRHAFAFGQSRPDTGGEESDNILYENIICNAAISESDYKMLLNSIDIETSIFDEKIPDSIIIRLLKFSKIPLSESNFTNVISHVAVFSNEITSVLVVWFENYQDEFITGIDHYLESGEVDSFRGMLLEKIMFSAKLPEALKLNVFNHQADYYRESGEDGLNIPQDLKIMILNQPGEGDIKYLLFSSLIDHKFTDRKHLALLAKTLQEKELYKIFTQRTATLTLKDREGCQPLLDKLKQAKIIRDFEFMDDGRVYLRMRYPELNAAE